MTLSSRSPAGVPPRSRSPRPPRRRPGSASSRRWKPPRPPPREACSPRREAGEGAGCAARSAGSRAGAVPRRGRKPLRRRRRRRRRLCDELGEWLVRWLVRELDFPLLVLKGDSVVARELLVLLPELLNQLGRAELRRARWLGLELHARGARLGGSGHSEPGGELGCWEKLEPEPLR